MKERARSVAQLVANRGRERKLSRADAFVAYAMDRLLFRLGRSRYARSFYLKGGVLIASTLATPHRFSRDIDLLARSPCDPEALRKMFREIVEVDADDGLSFDPDQIRATLATRETDGYDGIKLRIPARIAEAAADVSLDIGVARARTSRMPSPRWRT